MNIPYDLIMLSLIMMQNVNDHLLKISEDDNGDDGHGVPDAKNIRNKNVRSSCIGNEIFGKSSTLNRPFACKISVCNSANACLHSERTLFSNVSICNCIRLYSRSASLNNVDNLNDDAYYQSSIQ
ncbi:hypothetical protein DERP_006007 [Dermatophagoides pteronyssinus]|uniref:Uncharacterized protein n=1 Tax=Dermatophagoides pteronyssinus TaxID=6956 RepID=A0ABQ8JS46_DERPT|nr:hypothetical protein DERP_006007 [Dermatophagoides pteronyssinus]